MHEVGNPYNCLDCPLQDRTGLRTPSTCQLEFMNRYKDGEHHFERGELILREGDIPHRLYTVLEGVLIRFHKLDDGRRQIVNFMFPGDLVGLQAALHDPSAHSVEALLPARLCVFKASEFIDLVVSHPQLSFDVTWLAAKEERALEEHIVTLGQRSARERVIYLAVWLIARGLATGLTGKDNVLELPITQGQIADMLGLSLVHTNRTLRAVEREGIVKWSPREICIPDLEAAATMAGFDLQPTRQRPYI